MKESMVSFSGEFIKQLPKGVFLSAEHNGIKNTMTIGWANIGVIWGRPVITVLIRPSRYTNKLVDRSGEFTISIPEEGSLREAVTFCGTKSGRDYDKFTECSLTAVKGKTVDAPVIKECRYHYECKVKGKVRLDPEDLDRDIDKTYYAVNDYHYIYFAEILSAYEL